MDERIREAVDKADLAFWASIVESYPTAVSGDLEPEIVIGLHVAQVAAVRRWVEINVPKER